MGLYIVVTKESDCDDEVLYRFETIKNAGKLSINKTSGEITLVEKLPGDDRGHMFARAARKVQLAFEKGEFPDVVTWAS